MATVGSMSASVSAGLLVLMSAVICAFVAIVFVAVASLLRRLVKSFTSRGEKSRAFYFKGYAIVA